MNRKERRAQEKKLRSSGLSKTQAKETVKRYYTNTEMDEGQVVKFNYELMIRRPDWKSQKDEFREWVTAHKDEQFTVEWEKMRKDLDSPDKKVWVCLKEDDTEPKWLFHTDTLIPLATAKIKLDSGEEKDIVLGDITNSEDPRIQEAIDEAMKEE